MNVGQASRLSPFSCLALFRFRQAACHWLDAVMATVPHAFGLRTERCHETTREEFAIRPCPTHGNVMTAQVILRRKRIRRNAIAVMLHREVAQHGFPEPARPAVNEHHELLLTDADFFERSSVEDLLHGLQFSEVISTADCAKGTVELRGLKTVRSEEFTNVLIPRVLKVEPQRSPAIKLHLTPKQAGLEQRHAAADIAPDHVRVNEFVRHERRTDGRAPTRMKIRKTDGELHALEFRRGIKLAHSFAFNPRLRRGNQPHNWNGCAPREYNISLHI